jgi:hypothetical protein
MQHWFNINKTMWDSGDAWIPLGGLLSDGIFNGFPIWEILLWGRFVYRMFWGHDDPGGRFIESWCLGRLLSGKRWNVCWVRSHAPSIPSHRGTKVVWPDFQPMRVPEEPVCIDLFRQNPVFTSLHLKYPVHVVPPLVRYLEEKDIL